MGQWPCDLDRGLYTKDSQFRLCCHQRHSCFIKTSCFCPVCDYVALAVASKTLTLAIPDSKWKLGQRWALSCNVGWRCKTISTLLIPKNVGPTCCTNVDQACCINVGPTCCAKDDSMLASGIFFFIFSIVYMLFSMWFICLFRQTKPEI